MRGGDEEDGERERYTKGLYGVNSVSSLPLLKVKYNRVTSS